VTQKEATTALYKNRLNDCIYSPSSRRRPSPSVNLYGSVAPAGLAGGTALASSLCMRVTQIWQRAWRMQRGRSFLLEIHSITFWDRLGRDISCLLLQVDSMYVSIYSPERLNNTSNHILPISLPSYHSI
jgi:hypothetical protein